MITIVVSIQYDNIPLPLIKEFKGKSISNANNQLALHCSSYKIQKIDVNLMDIYSTADVKLDIKVNILTEVAEYSFDLSKKKNEDELVFLRLHHEINSIQKKGEKIQSVNVLLKTENEEYNFKL